MKRLRLITSLFLVGFSIFIGLSSFRLGFGRVGNPGAGFMPSLASALLFILALLVFIMELKISAKDEGKRIIIGWRHLKRPISLFIMLFGYSFILNFFGFLISIFFTNLPNVFYL